MVSKKPKYKILNEKRPRKNIGSRIPLLLRRMGKLKDPGLYGWIPDENPESKIRRD